MTMLMPKELNLLCSQGLMSAFSVKNWFVNLSFSREPGPELGPEDNIEVEVEVEVEVEHDEPTEPCCCAGLGVWGGGVEDELGDDGPGEDEAPSAAAVAGDKGPVEDDDTWLAALPLLVREGSLWAVLRFCNVVVVRVLGNVSGKNLLCMTVMSLMGQ